jgi:hypothetical protein
MAIARTRADIRREVATTIGDGKMVVQTSAEGALNTFTDERRLNDEDTYYAGADIVITGGVDENLNEVRYIVNSERISSTVTLTPNWNTTPVLGTPAEIYNIHGMGATVPEWNSFINQAINEAATLSASVATTISLGSFSADSWYDSDYEDIAGSQQSLAIPAGIEWAGTVFFTKNGRNYYPPRGGMFTGEGWKIDDVTRRVVIEGDLIHDADGAVFFLQGWGPPNELQTDQDVTAIPPIWLYAKIKALAYARIQEKGLFDLRGEATKWESIAKDAQRLLRPGEFPPNTVRLWG